MTTNAFPQVPDEHEDSPYNDTSESPPPNSVPDENVLDPTDDKVTQLDNFLDIEDEQGLSEESSDVRNHVPSIQTPSEMHTHSEPITELPGSENHDDDLRFDSDEHADVESLASTDDEATDSSSVPPLSVSPARTSKNISDPTNSLPAYGASLPIPSKGTASQSSSSILTRASHTFYKTFIKKRNPSADHSSGLVPSQSHQTSTKGPVKSGSNEESTDQKLARLCQLIDAQLSALSGAKTGFVQLALLRPLAEQTLQAIEIDARALLEKYADAEQKARCVREEVLTAQQRGEEEIVRKERLLIEAKVALAETCGDVERLRGELASTKRALSDPSRKLEGQRKKVEAIRRETISCREARTALEERLAERRRSLSREKVELSRLEKEYRDLEGDWT